MSTDDRRPRSADQPPSAPTPAPEERVTPEDADRLIAEPPLKYHGDALLDGSGSRQGTEPDASRDAAPHE